MKRTLAIMLALLLSLSFTACSQPSAPAPGGGNNNPPSGQGSNDANSGGNTSDEVFNLTFSYHSPDTNSSVVYSKAWAEEITEASGGRITFAHFTNASLTNAVETLDAARNGTCDLSWTTPAFYPGSFNTTFLLANPMLGWPGNEDGGAIGWNVFEQVPEMQQEWSGVKLISLYPMGENVIETSKIKINGLNDLKGLRIRTNSAIQGAFITALGAIPVNIAISDIYENMQKNVIDGTLVDWNWSNSARLWDVAKFAVEESIFNSVGAIVMNQAAYDKLPADLQQIIDERCGLYASKMGGRMTAEFDMQFRQNCIDGGMEVYTPSADVSAALNEAANAAIETWHGQMDDADYDGQSMIDIFLTEMKAFGYSSPMYS